jgi:hypothetical protein
VLDAAGRLASLEVFGFAQPVTVIVDHWPVLTLAAALAALLVMAFAARRGGAHWLPPDARTAR